MEIAADGGEVPELTVQAVEQGIPIPRDGSLFGWACQDMVTTLIVVYASYRPESPVPVWSVMPLVGTPELQWPPFERRAVFRELVLEGLLGGEHCSAWWPDRG